MTTEDILLERFKHLPVNYRQELLDFAEFLTLKKDAPLNRVSLKGIWSDLDVNISEEMISEARNEMWRGYTKDTEDQR